MGKKFKTSEMLSGRFADVFSNIYLSYSMLWYYEKYCPKDEQTRKLLEFCMDELLFETQEIFTKLLQIILISLEKKIYWSSFIPMMEEDINHQVMK